jgi:beta-glucosidase
MYWHNMFKLRELGQKRPTQMPKQVPKQLQPSVTTQRNFLWGAASAAFQIEGSPTGVSIWDDFCIGKTEPNNGPPLDPSVACNSFIEYEKDIAALKAIGLNAYRLSISWCRLFPDGRGDTPDAVGVAYYNTVFDLLQTNGIEPIVTLFHWDLPSALQTEYNGWISGSYSSTDPTSFVPTNYDTDTPKIAKDFADYAEACFRAFPQIKYWGSINEAQTFAVDGNEFNWQAPGLGSGWGDSPQGIEYRVVHNMLLAHAEANDRLNTIRAERKSIIYFGMMNNGDFGSPLDDTSPASINAAERRNIFWLAWLFDPIFFGDYPAVMKDPQYTGTRLPVFTATQKEKLRGSSNIMYINTYTSKYVQDGLDGGSPTVGWFFDSKTADKDSILLSDGVTNQFIGRSTESSWNFIVPKSMLYLPLWYQHRYSGKSPTDNHHGKGIRFFVKTNTNKGKTKDIYRNIPVMITENGLSAKVSVDSAISTIDKYTNDTDRINYYEGYLNNLGPACNAAGINLIGYLAWSLCDNFEWGNGYSQRFGLCYVDIVGNNTTNSEHARTLKDSANWYKNYILENKNGPKVGFKFKTYGPDKSGSDIWYYKTIESTGETKT